MQFTTGAFTSVFVLLTTGRFRCPIGTQNDIIKLYNNKSACKYGAKALGLAPLRFAIATAPRKSNPALFRRTAAIVRYRRDVFDATNFNADG